MSDDDIGDDSEVREFVRAVFRNVDHTPPDVVPSTGLTRADLERQSANYMKSTTGTIPGEILTDSDGNPIGVAEAREVTSIFGGTFITAAQAEQFGIESEDLPGIFIIGEDNNHE